ncbi:MAG: bacillithiol biosynthesis cysteine-adding enzyme BshC [Flavobacteriales bacterium]
MLNNTNIAFSQTNLLPPIINDLLKQGELNFDKKTDRKLLVSKLNEQYSSFDVHEKVSANIESLLDENTFTVTTGHQLCLLGGPAYFIYKIVSTIKACELYAAKYPTKKFVPVFWLASEDHDFEEVNHLYLFGKKVEWKTTQTGAVGRMKMEGFSEVFSELESIVEIPEFFRSSWSSMSSTSSLSSFTKTWLNKLFAPYGLIIIDADDRDLKRSFSPIIEKEFSEKIGKREVEKTNAILSEKYKLQVNPRDINFFLLEDNKRERFVEDGSDWKKMLEENPEKFSPNVIYRPLYQEFILPNVAYVGGPNELAYWFQLTGVFAAHNLVYPQLILRDSFVVLDANQQKMLNALHFSLEDIFENTELLKSKFLKSKMEISDSAYQSSISQLFDALKAEVSKIDATLGGSVDAEKAKTSKSIENLFARIKKAEKARHEIDLNKIDKLKNQLFPEGVFQERRVNFLEFYSRYGANYIDALLQNANPLNSCLKVLAEA